MEEKSGIWVLKECKEKTTFGNDSHLCKNDRPQNTNTNNGLVKNKRKSSKRVCTRGSRVRPKLVRLIIEPILFFQWHMIKRKIIGSAWNRNRQTHCQATLIYPTKVIIKAIDVIKRKIIGKIYRNLSNYAQIKGKVSDNTTSIKNPKFKLDENPLQRRIYFPTFIKSLEIIFSRYKEACELILNYP